MVHVEVKRGLSLSVCMWDGQTESDYSTGKHPLTAVLTEMYDAQVSYRSCLNDLKISPSVPYVKREHQPLPHFADFRQQFACTEYIMLGNFLRKKCRLFRIVLEFGLLFYQHNIEQFCHVKIVFFVFVLVFVLEFIRAEIN